MKSQSPVQSPESGRALRSSSPQERGGGFTLLELIVAMMIFGVVLSAAYALFDSGRTLSSKAEMRAELFQTARAALKAIEQDLKGAVMPNVAYDTGFLGTDGGSGDQPLDKIEFIAVNGHTMPRSLKADSAHEPILTPKTDLSKVTYWVEGRTERPAHGLVRWRQAVLGPDSIQNMKDEEVEEVAPDVIYLNLRYYDTDWRDSWDSTQVRKMPKAVEVTVHVQGEWRMTKVVEKFTTRFYLHVAAETPERQQ